MSFTCSDAVGVPEPLIILVKVDNLDSEGLSLLDVAGILLNYRVHVLNDTVGLLLLFRVFNVTLKLSKDLVLFAFSKFFLEERIFKQNVERSCWAAIDLANDVRDDESIPFLGLINELVQQTVLANLQGSGLNLTMLLSVGVTSELAWCSKLSS